jgi:acyl-CoA reductase-like NAD-dependent aldehyde dehydrogenase
MVMVTLPTAVIDYHVPFGGTKGLSVSCREQVSYATEFYTTVKTAYTPPQSARYADYQNCPERVGASGTQG